MSGLPTRDSRLEPQEESVKDVQLQDNHRLKEARHPSFQSHRNICTFTFKCNSGSQELSHSFILSCNHISLPSDCARRPISKAGLQGIQSSCLCLQLLQVQLCRLPTEESIYGRCHNCSLRISRACLRKKATACEPVDIQKWCSNVPNNAGD